jgi:hypothetical protein
VTVEVPPNSSADVVLPAGSDTIAIDGREASRVGVGLPEVAVVGAETRLSLESGTYVVEAVLHGGPHRTAGA